jgi:hypothetical protein
MTSPFRPAAPAESLPAYYNDLSDETIQHCFRNFDNVGNFDLFDRQTRNPKSANFCLDFGEQEAFCAFDLDAQAYSKLLASPRPPYLHTRWINIWMPYNQKDLLKVLGQYFDFTPRLLGMMRSDPCPPKSPSMRKKKSSSTLRSMLSHRSSKSGSTQQRAKEANQAMMDSEESIGMTELMHSAQLEMVQDLSHYQLVDDVWHWSTVDWGRRCKSPRDIGECSANIAVVVCIGYNSLHNVRTKPVNDQHNDDKDRTGDVPHGKRVWNWLLLCEDKTVISISEDPFPFSNGDLHADELKLLYTARRNLVNVFRQLSKAPTPLRDTALIQLPIRSRVGQSEEETVHRSTDAPGLLFYYLFEDWGTTFNLISPRRHHGYGSELDRLVRLQHHSQQSTNTNTPPATRNAPKSRLNSHRPTAPPRLPTRRAKARLPRLRAHHRACPKETRSLPRIPQKLPHHLRRRVLGLRSPPRRLNRAHDTRGR